MRATRLCASAAVASLIAAFTAVVATAASAHAGQGLAPQYAGSATTIPETVVESGGSPLWVFGLIACIACATTTVLWSVTRRIRRDRARTTSA